MFIVQNSDNVDCFKSESFNRAKEIAERMKDECGENFSIVEIKQVWTTQTLDEAINRTLADRPRVPSNFHD
jgi:hypothetical protein